MINRRSLLTTAVTVAEIRYGLERLPDGRRDELRGSPTTLGALPARCSFDLDAANRYGAVAERERGRPMSALDAQIAAICLSRGASLATRNVRDFAGTGVEVLDPWGP